MTTMRKKLPYKCKCGGRLKKSYTEVEFYGIDFGTKECEICTECKTEYLSEDVLGEIEAEIMNIRTGISRHFT